MVSTKSEIKCKYISFIKWVFVNARTDLYGEECIENDNKARYQGHNVEWQTMVIGPRSRYSCPEGVGELPALMPT